MASNDINLYCAITLYNPDTVHILNLINTIAPFFIKILLIDNSAHVNHEIEAFSSTQRPDRVFYLKQQTNLGIPAAYNMCIDAALESQSSSDAIIFFDQDSLVTPSQLETLIFEFKELTKENIPFGVYAAKAISIDGISYYRNVEPVSAAADAFYFETDFAISSFSLVPMSTFLACGKFDEDLFIDLVDYDFCLTCKEKNLPILCSKNVTFTHAIGNSQVKISSIVNFPISAPFRYYYQARNTIIVHHKHSLKNKIPVKLAKKLAQILITPFPLRDFFTRLFFLFKGIKDGFLFVSKK